MITVNLIELPYLIIMFLTNSLDMLYCSLMHGLICPRGLDRQNKSDIIIIIIPSLTKKNLMEAHIVASNFVSTMWTFSILISVWLIMDNSDIMLYQSTLSEFYCVVWFSCFKLVDIRPFFGISITDCYANTEFSYLQKLSTSATALQLLVIY